MPVENRKLRLGMTIVLTLYWVALFTATHLPKIPEPLEFKQVSDKLEHYVAYAGLGFLVAARQALGVGMSWRRAGGIWLLIAAYGACDEITQIPVGRDADLRDWFADLAGAAFGIAALSLIRAVFVRPRSSIGD